ncbi:MAG: RDD family protein, partial [Actinobacteria bacterium]|nr:RDD family protein [Actinomycetota bacterium]
MQQARTEDRIEYASLGWRIAAVAVDTAVLFAILTLVATVWVFVLAAQGRIDPNDPAAAQTLARDVAATPNWVANTALFGTLFIYYVVLEGIVGASVGKLVFHMRVVMRDGSRPTGVAIVVRNLVRILEAYLLYIPAGISCLASSRRQRLGDHAARTVVVRRAAGGRPTQAP